MVIRLKVSAILYVKAPHSRAFHTNDRIVVNESAGTNEALPSGLEPRIVRLRGRCQNNNVHSSATFCSDYRGQREGVIHLLHNQSHLDAPKHRALHYNLELFAFHSKSYMKRDLEVIDLTLLQRPSLVASYDDIAQLNSQSNLRDGEHFFS